MPQGDEGDWETLELTVDSGAVDHVGPPEAATGFDVQESEKSRAGFNYIVANGSPLPNEGEKHLAGMSLDWKPMKLKMQVANVKKILASVSKLYGKGSRVVFDDVEGSYVEDK